MANVYIISSSPPARDMSIFDMPSSPSLPPVSEILKRKPQAVRTGSRAAPIPQHATATFTSAATLLNIESSKFSVVGNAENSAESAKTKRRKVAAHKIDHGEVKITKSKKIAAEKTKLDGEEEAKKPRKSRAKVTSVATTGEAVTKEPAARRARAKKPKKKLEDEITIDKPVRKIKAKKAAESQSKLPKGKVTKISTGPPKDIAFKVNPDPYQDSSDNGMVEAVRRRFSWTPPPQSLKESGTTPIDVGLLDGSASADSLLSGEKSRGFTDLLGNYGFTKAGGKAANPPLPIVGEGVRKRKLIELVKTSVATAAAASAEKAPKKKPRTLTDLATSVYAKEEAAPTDPAPLLQYFSLETSEQTTADGFKIPAKRRSRSPVKGGLRVKKGTLSAPILLSPESAMKQVGRQDFVFGTSSQLAREDSPTLLRDLHEAMQASNEADDDPPAGQLIDSISQTLSERGMLAVSAQGKLWSAASRDIAGDLQIVEMVDLIDTPMAAKTLSRKAIIDESTGVLDGDDGFWRNAEEPSQSLVQDPRPNDAQSQPHPDDTSTEGIFSSPSKKPILNRPTPESSTPISTRPPKPSQEVVKATKKSAKTKNLVKPDYSSYTTARLAKEIATYRFKPIKSRNQMILLLGKCWEGKNRTALAALGTNTPPVPRVQHSKPAAPTQTQVEGSPKRPRGRHRKNSLTLSPANTKTRTAKRKSLETVENLEMDSDTPLSQLRTPRKSQKVSKDPPEDIFDPEPAITPSPPRRKGSPKKIKALILKISNSDNDAGPELSPSSSQTLLFKHITSAVKNAPSAKDSTNPSWHEKILLYDPIILEDLTIWLNTGALAKAGWDGEVDPKEVKKWCESKSICCLWKENLRGGTRSRY